MANGNLHLLWGQVPHWPGQSRAHYSTSNQAHNNLSTILHRAHTDPLETSDRRLTCQNTAYLMMCVLTMYCEAIIDFINKEKKMPTSNTWIGSSRRVTCLNSGWGGACKSPQGQREWDKGRSDVPFNLNVCTFTIYHYRLQGKHIIRSLKYGFYLL